MVFLGGHGRPCGDLSGQQGIVAATDSNAASACRIGYRDEQLTRASRGLVGELPAADDRQPLLSRIEDPGPKASREGQPFEVGVFIGYLCYVGGSVKKSHDTARDT
jgi:hypothetical protein